MKSRNSFIATASGVLITLTTIVAEGAAQTPAAGASSTPLQAKVIDCVGKARWRTGSDVAWKDAKDAKVEDLLSAGAEVRTGLRSRMTLKFDNATVLIDSNSNFAMPTVELVKSNDGDVYRTIAQMKSGRADFQVDKVGAKNDFQVVTPSSTLAVRGTGFSVMTGAMSGTEVVGARTNAIAAIQLKYAASSQIVQLSGGGGEAKSSTALPEPATSALITSIGAAPMVGTSTSEAEHLVSAIAGTSQAPAQTQATNTVAAVAAAVADAADGFTEEGDLLLAAVQSDASEDATDGAGAQLQAAIIAMTKAQEAYLVAQDSAEASRTARNEVMSATASVVEQLALVNEALTDSGDARSDALESARQALAMFASGAGQSASVRAFRDAAVDDADRARDFAEDALSGSDLVVDFTDTALERLDDAIEYRISALAAASTASDESSNAAEAAVRSHEFLALVIAARDELATIFARRSMPPFEASLNDAIDRLVLASQAVIEADSLRDGAISTALAAHAEAANTVLAAVQTAALNAAEEALAAFNAATAAQTAASDAQTGMENLDLAIDAMLDAQSQSSAALAQRDAAEAFRAVAQARVTEAQSSIEVLQSAQNTSAAAQVAAGAALLDAQRNLDDAIAHSGFATVEMQTILAALTSQDQGGARSASMAAREFAGATLASATFAQTSADAAEASAQSASGISQGSLGTLESYADQLQVIRAALTSAIASAASSADAATSSHGAAESAETYGTAFASQFANTAAAQAALLAVQRAIDLASAADQYASEVVQARDAVALALALVTDAQGNAFNFSAIGASAALALNHASDANAAAILASNIAAVVNHEAATAEFATGALDKMIAAQAELVVTSDALDATAGAAATAEDRLDVVDTRSADAVAASQVAQSAAEDGAASVSALGGILMEFEGRLNGWIVALDNGDIEGALAIEDGLDGDEVGEQASEHMSLVSAASIAANIAADSVQASAVEVANLLVAASFDLDLVGALSQDTTNASNLTAVHALAAQGRANASELSAVQAVDDGSINGLLLTSISDAASGFAVQAATASTNASELAVAAGVTFAGLSARFSAVEPAVTDAVTDAVHTAQLAAANASASNASAQAIFALGTAEGNVAREAFMTLSNKLDTDLAASLVESGLGQATAQAQVIENAIQVHSAALAGAIGAEESARLGFLSASDSNLQTQIFFNSAVNNLDGMSAAFSAGDLSGGIDQAGLVGQQASQASEHAGDSLNASTNVAQQAVAAAGFAETSRTEAERAYAALNAAQVGMDGIGFFAAIAQQRAADSQVSSGNAVTAADVADSTLGYALANRALALSIASVARAYEALAAHGALQGVVADQSSAVEQAAFQQTETLATSANTYWLNAQFTASVAADFAAKANDYANLAGSTVGSVNWGVVTLDHFNDANSGLEFANNARNDAQAAIANHNGVLASVGSDTVGSESGLVLASMISLNESAVQRDLAIGFADQANLWFILTVPGDFADANNSSGFATQSESAAGASDAAATATRNHADSALALAAISTQSGVDYGAAVANAELFAAASGSASAGAVESAPLAEAYAQAAINFAAVIGSASSTTAVHHAIQARDSAIAHRDAALVSYNAALASAANAHSMGMNVFFTRTAEVAAGVVARADQARSNADVALAASAQARADANAAQAVAAGSGGST